MLENGQMETVATCLSIMDDNENDQILLNDWKCLSYRSSAYDDFNPSVAEAELYISTITTVQEYLERRPKILEMIQPLSSTDKKRVCIFLCHKAAALLIQKFVPQILKKRDEPLLRRQYFLLQDLYDCISAGGEAFALFFLHYDDQLLRISAPWNQNADVTVWALYQMAYDISVVAQRGSCWNHDLLIFCFWTLLDLKVRCLLDHQMNSEPNAHGILELHCMVGWTNRQEFHPYWELSRFQAQLKNYVSHPDGYYVDKEE